MDTITLKEISLSFNEALNYLIAGKCIGIKPGNNINYLEPERQEVLPSRYSDDFILKWKNSKSSNIRVTQYLGVWHPVIIDHRKIK